MSAPRLVVPDGDAGAPVRAVLGGAAPPGAAVSAAPPAELPGRLLRGEADAALLDAADALRLAPAIELVPGAAVSSFGPAGIARLRHATPLDAVEAIACEAPEEAPALLARLLFHASGRRPAIVPWGDRAAAATAAVVRGGEPGLFMKPRSETPQMPLDGPHVGPVAHGLARGSAGRLGPGTGHRGRRPRPASRCGGAAEGFMNSPGEGRTDLGEAWSALTGLPFVWLVWCCRPGRLDRNLYGAVHTTMRAARRRFEPSQGSAVAFRLGRSEIEGLGRFRAELIRAGLLPDRPQPRLARLTNANPCG